MSTHFTSVEMIKSQFSLEDEATDNLRSKLRKMQAKLHPDKNGGSFADKDSESEYHKLDEAISFIDSMNVNSHLTTISAVTDLTKAVTAMMTAQNENPASAKDTFLSAEINRSIESYSSRLKMPRIALTAVTIAIFAIWMFPTTVKEHPVLSQFINFESTMANIAWFYILISATLFWVITWRKEELTKQYKESLKTESVQNKLFNRFIDSVNGNSFTLEEFVEFIVYRNNGHRHPFSILFGSSRRIDSPLAHATAEVILERALKRKALTFTNSGSISTVYRILSVNKHSESDSQTPRF